MGVQPWPRSTRCKICSPEQRSNRIVGPGERPISARPPMGHAQQISSAPALCAWTWSSVATSPGRLPLCWCVAARLHSFPLGSLRSRDGVGPQGVQAAGGGGRGSSDGSLGGDAAGEVQAGVPGGAYLATRASLALVLVLTARASEISFARAACPTVDPPLEARGTGKPARRDPPPRRVVRSPHDLPVASPGSRIRVSSAPPRRSLAVASSAVSDPVRPHPKTNDERSRALATTGSIRRQDERHLAVHVRQVRHVVPGDHRDRLPE